MKKFTLKFFLILSGILLVFSNKPAWSDDYVSTTDAIRQIENALSTNDSSNSKASKGKLSVKAVSDSDNSSDDGSDDSSDNKGDDKNSDNADDEPKVDIKVTDVKVNQKNAKRSQLAYNAMVAGQYEAAVELYKRVVQSDPKDQYAQFSLAVCYHKLAQYKQAKTIYYNLLKSDYENKNEVIGNLLEIIVQESPNDAIYVLAKLSVTDPGAAYILARSAAAYDKLQKPEQAIVLLSEAIEADPTNADYKANLAVIYDKKGDYKNAFNMYNSAVEAYLANGDSNQLNIVDQLKQRAEFIKDKI